MQSCSLLLILLVTPLAIGPQVGEDAERQQILTAARRIMTEAGSCALITIGGDGYPRARTMDPFPPEDDWTVWLATNAATRKVAEITRSPRVTLYYFLKEDPGYVTLVGDATLIRDPAAKAAHWKEAWKPFYSDANRGEDYLLIRVHPRQIEVVSYSAGVASSPKAWRSAVVEFEP